MHRIPSPNLARSATRGFSLPEIALSLAVLSIAFVSLFALLPFGLASFRASIDTSNETWIMQGLNSMIQTTEWEKIWGPNATITEDIYYFDEEGRLTDTLSNPTNDDKVRRSRLYQAKLFVVPFYRPAQTTATDAFVAVDTSNGESKPVAVRIIAVMGNMSNAKATALFEKLERAEQIDNLPVDSGLSVRAFVATQMNSVIKSI
jgi:prepilin-type N-terminal cleavage/methylation domain-containing protein